MRAWSEWLWEYSSRVGWVASVRLIENWYSHRQKGERERAQGVHRFSWCGWLRPLHAWVQWVPCRNHWSRLVGWRQTARHWHCRSVTLADSLQLHCVPVLPKTRRDAFMTLMFLFSAFNSRAHGDERWREKENVLSQCPWIIFPLWISSHKCLRICHILCVKSVIIENEPIFCCFFLLCWHVTP